MPRSTAVPTGNQSWRAPPNPLSRTQFAPISPRKPTSIPRNSVAICRSRSQYPRAFTGSQLLLLLSHLLNGPTPESSYHLRTRRHPPHPHSPLPSAGRHSPIVSCLGRKIGAGPVTTGSQISSIVMDEQVDRLVKKTWGKWDKPRPPLRAWIKPMPAQIQSILKPFYNIPD